MATATAKTVYSHITKDPKVCGGRACIDGTRFRVMDVVFLKQQGLSPEQIVEEYNHLNLAQIYAALSYYHENKEEIEASFEEDEQFNKELDQQWKEHVARHGGNPPEVPAPEDRPIARPVNWRPKR
jgi:uncharacterized protein (DUF433 family)